MAIENLRVIGDVLYERRPDGKLYPVRRVAPAGLLSAPVEVQGSATGVPEFDRMLVGLGNVNQMLNPVESIGQSMAASRRMAAPDTAGWDRVAAFGDMLSGVAGVTAPVAAAARAGTPAAVALMEGLLGGSPTMTAAKDTAKSIASTIAERANQRGPVPVMGSNFGNLLGGVGIEDALRTKYPDVKLSISGSPERGYTLNKIDVPKDKRSSGVGTAVMGDLVKFADQQGAVLKLSPSGDFGGSVPRLKDFYARFGFIPNKGKNKDYEISEGMYRNPVAASPLPAPRNEAEAIAKGILELRATGNVDAVTEGMMNAADPQYMYNYTPLAMDQASRMARADESGRNVSAYRGTMSDEFSARNPKVFVSQNPDVVQSYAGHISFADEIGLPPELAQAEGGNIIPLLVNPSENSSIVKGYELQLPANQIRSRFARFDPMFSHLRNLSAGVAISPLAYGLLSDQYEREPRQ